MDSGALHSRGRVVVRCFGRWIPVLFRALITEVTPEMKRGSGRLQERQVHGMAALSGEKDQVGGQGGAGSPAGLPGVHHCTKNGWRVCWGRCLAQDCVVFLGEICFQNDEKSM